MDVTQEIDTDPGIDALVEDILAEDGEDWTSVNVVPRYATPDYDPLYPRNGVLYTAAMKMAQDEYDTWNNGRKMMGGKLGIQIFAVRKEGDFEENIPNVL